ncbi:MAG: phage tail protein [Candidatus Binataceae bacterium]
MAQLQLPPSINDLRSQSLLATVERLDALDLTPLLVYRLDSAPDSALIFLAWQFDMLDPQWQLAATISGESIDALTDIDTLNDIDTLLSSSGSAGPTDFDSWRALLQAAIPLHRVHGTPDSIRQALGSLGWGSVGFLEGQASWGGSAWPSSEGWAVFRVVVNLGAGQAVGTNDAARIIAAVNFFKPMRSWLDALVFEAVPLADAAPAPSDFTGAVDNAPAPSDLLTAPIAPLADQRLIAPIYNGHYYHIGITYGAHEPAVADSGVVANGVPISANG